MSRRRPLDLNEAEFSAKRLDRFCGNHTGQSLCADVLHYEITPPWVVLLPFHHLLLPGWGTWMDGWRDGWQRMTGRMDGKDDDHSTKPRVGTRDLRTLWSPPVFLNQERHTQRCKVANFIFILFIFCDENPLKSPPWKHTCWSEHFEKIPKKT